MERIGASEAKARFSELLARAGYSGERFVVERRGKPIAALVGVGDLEKLEGEGGDVRPRGAIALAGVWGDIVDEDEVDEMVSAVYAARESEAGRSVNLDDSE